jgi:alpha-amylase/alpha-mannosidase (GH57 family)
MKKVKLLFGIHCHQPVDNFHNIVFEAIEKSYKPFFQTVINYDFKFAVHFSGWLLEFIKNNDKELFNLMKKASDKGIVEFFTGGYYEPVLASIPSDDRKIQIEKLNRFIKENFGQEVKGLWLTERVWESSIVKDLVEVGIDYVMVDDYHFISNGYEKESLHGYYLTEEEGKKLKIFPIDKTLRYITPFKPVDRVMQYLKSIKGKAGIIFDDGEKFGIWPGTYKWVYEEK